MASLSALLQVFRLFRSRAHGASIRPPRRLGAGIDWECGVTDQGRRGAIELAAGAWIERGAVLHAYGGRIALGQNVFVGPHAVIYGHGGVEIGDDALISMHCRILSSNHAIPPFGTPIRHRPDELRPTRIGRDVWLGAGVTVLGGVTIGDGCIVGAGAVVARDLPAGAVAVGVPAAIVRYREGSPGTAD